MLTGKVLKKPEFRISVMFWRTIEGCAISPYTIQRFKIQRCHDQSSGRIKPSTPHRKVERFHWIIQIAFDSFPLKQKSGKIKHSLFPPMYILFRIAIMFVERINLWKPHNFLAFMHVVSERAICRCCMKYLFLICSKLIGKNLYWSLFLKSCSPPSCNFIQKETLAQMFSFES